MRSQSTYHAVKSSATKKLLQKSSRPLQCRLKHPTTIMTSARLRLFAFSLLCVTSSLNALSEDPIACTDYCYDPPESVAPSDRNSLTGDWNGARTKLHDAGVNFTATYANDILGNPVGGAHQGLSHADSLGLNLGLDLDKIMNIRGLHFFTSFVFRTGTNLSAKKIDCEFAVAQLFGSETYRINEILLKKTFLDDAIVIKAGRLNGGNDFLTSPLYCQFVNNTFCGNPVGIFYNTEVAFTAYPVAAWGAFIGIEPCHFLRMKFAVYNTDKNAITNKWHGASFTFHSTNGVFLITEWAYLNNQRHDTRGYPGNYKLGYYYLTGEKPKFQGGTQKGIYGGYILVDQMIFRREVKEAIQSITPFTALLFAPTNCNRFPFFMTAGIVVDAPIPSRRDDSLSLGMAYGHYSPELRSLQYHNKKMGIIDKYGNRPESFETVLEANYWIQINKWLAVTPDVQYIINPKGYGTIPNALVIGVELSANL